MRRNVREDNKKCETVTVCVDDCHCPPKLAKFTEHQLQKNILYDTQNIPLLSGSFLTPPDPIIAVGPDRFIAMVNSLITIRRKDTLEELYFDGTGNFFDVPATGALRRATDVWAIYDEFDQRFWLLGFRPDIPIPGRTSIFIAVSKDSTPSSRADFFFYYFDAEEFADYPKSAVDREAFYISVNEFTFAPPPGTARQRVYAFDKTSMINGTAPQQPNNILPNFDQVIGETFSVEANVDWQFIFPVQPRPVCPKDKKRYLEKVVLVQAIIQNPESIFLTPVFGNIIRVHLIKNIFTDPVIITADIEVAPFFSTFTGVPQPPPLVIPPGRPIVNLEALDVIIHNGDLYRNHLLTSHTIQTGRRDQNGNLIHVIRWYDIDVSCLRRGQVELLQQGNLDSGTNDNYFMSSIKIDRDGNIGLGFLVAGIDRFMSIGYTGRLLKDPKGKMRLPVQIPVEGTIYYQIGSGRNRAGDYSGLVVDPCDHKMFWQFNEYPVQVPIPSPTSAFNWGADWSTAVVAFTIDKGCPIQANAPQKENLITDDENFGFIQELIAQQSTANREIKEETANDRR